jgi:hypothetical protein
MDLVLAKMASEIGLIFKMVFQVSGVETFAHLSLMTSYLVVWMKISPPVPVPHRCKFAA